MLLPTGNWSSPSRGDHRHRRRPHPRPLSPRACLRCCTPRRPPIPLRQSGRHHCARENSAWHRCPETNRDRRRDRSRKTPHPTRGLRASTAQPRLSHPQSNRRRCARARSAPPGIRWGPSAAAASAAFPPHSARRAQIRSASNSPRTDLNRRLDRNRQMTIRLTIARPPRSRPQPSHPQRPNPSPILRCDRADCGQNWRRRGRHPHRCRSPRPTHPYRSPRPPPRGLRRPRQSGHRRCDTTRFAAAPPRHTQVNPLHSPRTNPSTRRDCNRKTPLQNLSSPPRICARSGRWYAQNRSLLPRSHRQSARQAQAADRSQHSRTLRRRCTLKVCVGSF